MSTIKIARQPEAENLAQAKDLSQNILDNWNFMTWRRLLADDVIFSLRLEPIGIDRVRDLNAFGGNLQVEGLEEAIRVLKSIYDDIKRGLCITTEIVSGYDVALLGALALESTKEGAAEISWPIVIYMEFNPEHRICVLTIAVVDLQPLSNAIRSAAQIGAQSAA